MKSKRYISAVEEYEGECVQLLQTGWFRLVKPVKLFGKTLYYRYAGKIFLGIVEDGIVISYKAKKAKDDFDFKPDPNIKFSTYTSTERQQRLMKINNEF